MIQQLFIVQKCLVMYAAKTYDLAINIPVQMQTIKELQNKIKHLFFYTPVVLLIHILGMFGAMHITCD